MSKYIDKYKVLEYIIFGVVGKDITCGELTRAIESLPTIEVSEDAISREHTLKIINAMREADKDNAVVYGKVYSQFKDAPSVLPKPKEGEWIPCSERTPIKEGHYLCSLKNPHRIDHIYIGLAYWTGGRWYGYLANEINAWMPLPKPWEGAEDE